MEEKNKKIESFSAKINNKTVYILLVEDPSKREKFRAFVGVDVISGSETFDLKGYEIKWSNRDKITGFDDAIKYANEFNKGPEDIVDIKYPWHRVISVRNVTYRRNDL